MKQVIVTGGRNYANWARVQEVLDLLDISLIIQGGAAGADRLARAYAKSRSIECITVPADWDKFGKAAGPIRNGEMLKQYPEAMIVAFPGGNGTQNCVQQAKNLKRLILAVQE